jgi:hypothetical protein
MCKKNGSLAILLTRYAVAPNVAKAPKLGGKFKKSPISLGAQADYTLRLLRPGYVYLYNPSDEKEPWRGYIVTQQRYLYPFRIPKDGPTPAPQLEKDFITCDPVRFVASAQTLVISNAANAEDVWIGFSDVEWTKDVWKRFDGNIDGCRDRTMRKINVKGWLDSPNAEHAELFTKMAEKIAEFTKTVQAKEFDFSHDPLVTWYSHFPWGTKKPADIRKEDSKSASSPLTKEEKAAIFKLDSDGGNRLTGKQAPTRKH